MQRQIAIPEAAIHYRIIVTNAFINKFAVVKSFKDPGGLNLECERTLLENNSAGPQVSIPATLKTSRTTSKKLIARIIELKHSKTRLIQ
jgi:hypothetical protein